MKLITRAEFGWGPTAASSANPRSGLVIHYDGSAQGLAHRPHSACVDYWVRTRKFHMGPSRGWVDIGYSWGACPHGFVFEGRGLNHVQAAQPGGNSTWYSVTLMSGPGEKPTDAQIDAVRQLRAWLMGKGVAGAVKGHRDFFSTSCPGDDLYRMVRDGTFTRAPSEPQPKSQQPAKPQPAPSAPAKEDPVPEVVSLGLGAEVVVPPNADYQPWWDLEWRDTAGWHPAGGQSIAPNADVWADIAAHLTLLGLAPGEAVQVGLTRHLADGSLVDVAWPNGQLQTVHADADGRVEVDLGGHFKLSKENRGRVTIRHESANEVTLEPSSVFKAILHRY